MAVTHGGNIFDAARADSVAWQQVLDFSASINPLGPSSAAREAVLASFDRIAHYPDRDATALREHLGQHWDVDPDRILAGNGAASLLFEWCRYAGPGTIAAPAFGEFHRAWPGAPFCRLDDRDTWPASGPVVLTRPANPCGTLIDANLIAEYAAGRSDTVLVDESFIDFCGTASLVTRAGGNLYVLRSLTKFWALPGLRAGVLVGDIGPLAAQAAPWEVNELAMAAAIASLGDRAHAARTREFVRAESAWLATALAALPGFTVWPPSANYVYAETAEAHALVQFARSRRILIRDCSQWPGFARPSIRVAVRPHWENRILVDACKEFLCA